MFSTSDTIVSIATPPGRGGVGMVRISGPDAMSVARGVVEEREAFRPRHATRVHLRDADGCRIDEALLTFFPAPRSYTAEDVVELSAHGSPPLLAAILAAAVAAGARIAEPGEFTLRAFLNGRVDLIQAEAVADLVAAVTPLQARVAFDQLEGTLTREVAGIDSALFDLCARLEACLDFPDEGYHFVTPAQTAEELGAARHRLRALLDHARAGRLIREGGQVVLLGRPNAGKSTLFNALVGTERAIVSEYPGTTRDLVSEAVDVAGHKLVFVDTAGIVETSEGVEREGVARSRRAAGVAAAALVVCDASQPFIPEDAAVWALCAPGGRLLVLTKQDLGVDASWARSGHLFGAAQGEAEPVFVSGKTGEGVPRVRDRLLRILGAEAGGWVRDVPLVTNVRHEGLLKAAEAALGRASEALAQRGLDQPSEELVLADVGAARQALESIVGRRTSEDMLRHIFERFCIGK